MELGSLENHTKEKKWKVEKKERNYGELYLEFLHIYLEFQNEDRKYGGECYLKR